MIRAGECLDNAMAGRFFSTLKAELVEARHWPTRAAARLAIFAWPEVWYNRQRCHSALAYCSPVNFEEQLLLLCHQAALALCCPRKRVKPIWSQVWGAPGPPRGGHRRRNVDADK